MKSVVLLLFYVACSFSGYSQSRQVEELKFSGYRWRFNHDESKRLFYLDYYIKIESDGKFELMRHNTGTGKAIYYRGVVGDTVLQFIDSTLFNNNYNTQYISGLKCLSPYNGLTYLLDYQIGIQKKTIQFGSSICLPDKINELKVLLNSVIQNAYKIRFKKINLDKYIRYLKKMSYPFLPPIPKKPPKDNKKIKFPRYP